MTSLDTRTPLDPLRQLLLSRITGQPPGPEAAGMSLPDLVEQRLGNDPLAAPLAAALRQREAALAAAEEDDAPAYEEDIAEGPGVITDGRILPPTSEQGRHAAVVMAQMYAELECLRARNDLLADALGACPRCWGEDQRCPHCRGRGVPGGRRPDKPAFEQFVVPAVRRRADPGRGAPAPATQSRQSMKEQP